MATFRGMPDGRDILISPTTLPRPAGARVIHDMRPSPRPRPQPPPSLHHLRRFPLSLRRGTPCTHLGEPTGEVRQCQTCGGAKAVAVRRCALHGECTSDRQLVHGGKRWAFCLGCADYTPAGAKVSQVEESSTSPPPRLSSDDSRPPVPPPRPTLRWAAAVTTVLERRDTLLPRTLASLRAAGFPDPTLFVDGCTFEQAADYERRFGVPVEVNRRKLRTYGNWILALARSYVLDPKAERYVVFQDDLVCSANLRAYLERCPYPPKGYLNCYLFPANEQIAPRDDQGNPRVGWYEGVQLNTSARTVPRPQKGLGAVALVFDRDAVQTLLASADAVGRPTHAGRGWKAADGGIVHAMNKAGWREFVHWPSLTQHVGDVSTMGNRPHAKAGSFLGESHDLLSLLERKP